MDEPISHTQKHSAQHKRSKFKRTGGSKNANSWSSSGSNTNATTTPKSLSQQSSLVATLLHDISSEVLVEDERPILPGVPVRAATLSALVRLCVHAFDHKGDVRDEFASFPRTLFLMHQWFTNSTELVFQFISNYESAPTLSPCAEPTCPHNCVLILSPGTSSESSSSSNSTICSTFVICKTQRFRAQILHALRYWISNFPIHFGVDTKLQETLNEFRGHLCSEGNRLLDISGIPSYDWIRIVSFKEPDASRPSRKVSLVFNHLEPHELALHLTFLEHKVIRRITFEDFKNYADNGTLEENPKLERSVSLFNGLSQWIQCVVLSRPTPAQRADVIVKFVHVAKNLRRLQNFNSLMGVVGSLSHSALARLTKTMDCVPQEERKTLKELATLVSSSANFSLYRKALAEAKGFKIPILGVHLKDLISLHTALPDYVEGGLINFRKMSQLSQIFSELDNLAQSMPPAEASIDLLNTLRVSLDLTYSEDEIYELSLSREPKTSVSPTRSPGVDVGNCSYEKQLQSMVDAVFRNYDSNHDGFISKEEFQAICTNHPAIDAFFVLDENRDGVISKLELERYLRNKKNAGSRHNFHEQTYFKPTFCIHCSGLLWGLIRQGFKCRNCGVNAHKYCRDYMLHECKMGPLLYFPSPEPQVKRRGFRIRKKSSSQSESGSPPSPKLFNSLEQLSLSVESSDLPGTSHTTHFSHQHGNGHSGSSTATQAPNLFTSAPVASTSSANKGSLLSSCSFASSSQNVPCHGTPKSSRRFSSVLSRPSSSVPSSPKLGLSSISIPLWSPCKSLFHPGSSSSTHHPSTPVPSQSSGGGSFVTRAGHGLGKLFGSNPHSNTSNPESPHPSPQMKQRKVPSEGVASEQSPLANTSTNTNISQQSNKRQITGVR